MQQLIPSLRAIRSTNDLKTVIDYLWHMMDSLGTIMETMKEHVGLPAAAALLPTIVSDRFIHVILNNSGACKD